MIDLTAIPKIINNAQKYEKIYPAPEKGVIVTRDKWIKVEDEKLQRVANLSLTIFDACSFMPVKGCAEGEIYAVDFVIEKMLPFFNNLEKIIVNSYNRRNWKNAVEIDYNELKKILEKHDNISFFYDVAEKIVLNKKALKAFADHALEKDVELILDEYNTMSLDLLITANR